ncbi:MAG TPA: hypothetical protein VFL83_03420 [Anaeromyxobacter sp.]|nr:hypothetical protein [Anaeromyxobacter sp.]
MRRASSLAAIAAFAIACGRDGDVTRRDVREPPADDGGDGAPGGGDPQGPACRGLVTVRLRGVDQGALATFDVALAALDVEANGATLPPRWSASGTLALAGVESRKLAVLASTPGETVEVTLRLAGIHACDGARCLDLDLCTAPISFRFDPDRVSPERCHVVLHLDLADSVQPLGDGVAFLPRFSVHY